MNNGMDKLRNDIPSALILFDKPPGITSFDALHSIKKSLGTGKVGHTGTLDKFARGLMLVLTGRALKLSPWFTGCDKRYNATIFFGAETDTLDPEGVVVANAELPSLNEFEKALPRFTGVIRQVPPQYSAIHINGKRASALARGGEAPEMKERQVQIYEIKLLEWSMPYARIHVHCSSGTYIRSLARDLALAAGSRAHLSALERTQIAGFMPVNWEQGTGIRGCCSIENIPSGLDSLNSKYASPIPNTGPNTPISSPIPNPQSLIPFPIDKNVFRLLGIPWFEITEKEAPAFIQGKALAPILADRRLIRDNLYMAPPGATETLSAAVFRGEQLIALIEKTANEWKYGYVYARS